MPSYIILIVCALAVTTFLDDLTIALNVAKYFLMAEKIIKNHTRLGLIKLSGNDFFIL